jgi:hypothetical protein
MVGIVALVVVHWRKDPVNPPREVRRRAAVSVMWLNLLEVILRR